MLKTPIKLIVFVIMLGTAYACSQKDSGFNTTESGLKYKIHTDVEENKPELGQILKLHMKYGSKDTVVFDNRRATLMPVPIMLIEPDYPGDINEGLSMLSKSDSATFVINTESFYNQTVQSPVPPYLDPDGELYFEIVLVDFMDEDVYFGNQEKRAEELMEQREELAKQEKVDLDDFLEQEEIQSKPLESGLVFIEIEKGEGEPVEAGNAVKVEYEGRLLDGTVFDSSEKSGSPIEFVAGHQQVIRGWDEGVMLMNEGGKAQFIIPSHLAYGEQGIQNVIPPYAPLVFDVEVVEVSKQN